MFRNHRDSTIQRSPKLVETAGEVLPGNRFLELVNDPADHETVCLLYRAGKRRKVASQIELGGKTFEAIATNVSDLHATRIPSTPIPDSPPARKLFSALCAAVSGELAMAQSQAERCSLFCLSTWLADALPIAPPAFISGPDPLEGLRVLRLLHALCRRPVLLAGSRSKGAGWHSLSPLFETLFIFRPELGPKYLRSLLASSNYPGIYIPGMHGVHELCRPKAIFVVDDAPQDDWFEGECVRLYLDGRSAYAALKDRRIEEISHEFQPQLLGYRTANWAKVHDTEIATPNFTRGVRNIARALAGCVVGDQQLTQRVISLLAEDELDARGRLCTDPRVAIVETLLACVHAGEKEVTMQNLASKTNSLLRERGEFREYSPMEVGWKLRALSFIPRRKASGRILSLGPDEIRRIHEIGKSLEVTEFQTPMQPCAWCKKAQTIVNTKLM